MSPYCDNSECHDSNTRVYADGGVTGTASTDWSKVKPPLLIFLGDVASDVAGRRRWCRAHALINEGWA